MTTTSMTTKSDCTLVVRRQPFGPSAAFAHFPAGQSLAQMLGADASHSLRVAVGGYPVPRELWTRVRPKAGTIIHATGYPQGGDGGKVLRMVALAALTYFTAGVGTGAYGSILGVSSTGGLAAMGAGMMVMGNLLLTPMVGRPLEVVA